MIQFNMLPDVKVDYIRTQRTKRIVMLGSLIAAAVSAFVLVMMFSYQATQKRHLSNLDKDISTIRSELENNKDLTRMLSVQNQLNTLPGLYDGRPAVDRLASYIEQTTPVGVRIGKVTIDFSTSKIELTGTADSLRSINEHVDTIKFSKFDNGEEGSEPVEAFKEVALTSFGKSKITDPSQAQNTASFSISLDFDPQIFDKTKKIALLTPSTTTTRSQQNVATDLFDGSFSEQEGQE